MSLTEKDVSLIVEAITQKSSGADKFQDAWSGNVMKLLVGLSNAGIVGLFMFVFTINTTITRIETNQDNMQDQMEVVQDFMKTPRFGRQDFIAESTPLLQRIERTEKILDNRAQWEDRMHQNERQIDILQSRLEELKKRIE